MLSFWIACLLFFGSCPYIKCDIMLQNLQLYSAKLDKNVLPGRKNIKGSNKESSRIFYMCVSLSLVDFTILEGEICFPNGYILRFHTKRDTYILFQYHHPVIDPVAVTHMPWENVRDLLAPIVTLEGLCWQASFPLKVLMCTRTCRKPLPQWPVFFQSHRKQWWWWWEWQIRTAQHSGPHSGAKN